MLTLSPFYYLRHGETDWNVDGRMQGHTDVPLNANGLAQAAMARDRLAGLEFATICTSPLSRARRTAEIVNEKHGRELVGDRRSQRMLALALMKDKRRGVVRAVAGGEDARRRRGPPQIPGPCHRRHQHGADASGPGADRRAWRRLLGDPGIREAGEARARNCLPLRHDPPAADFPFWRALAVE